MGKRNVPALAKAFGPKPAYHATTMLNHEALMSNHGPSLQPIDKQVEQVKASIVSIERDLTKASDKRQTERVTRLAGLLTSQRSKLAYLLDKLAAAPGFAPGMAYKAKAIDHTSYHPAGTKPQASKGRSVKATREDKARLVATIEDEARANATRYMLGKPKGTKA